MAERKPDESRNPESSDDVRTHSNITHQVFPHGDEGSNVKKERVLWRPRPAQTVSGGSSSASQVE